MTKENKSLYFIAIIPPKEVCDEITEFKNDFANRFESKAALRVMPHITLKAPFQLFPSEYENLLQWFQKMTIRSRPFDIQLKNFESFNNRNPVIYVHPVITAELQSLQMDVIKNFRLAYPQIEVAENELQFKPHITVAYRDLARAKFMEAWKEYKLKQYEALFHVNNFHLMQHSGRWNSVGVHSLR